MPAPAPPDEEASRHRLQETVGEAHRIEELLGRGGFAEVFAATDLRLGRRVAVKVLRPDLKISDALLERFQREARAVAALRHPNVLPIYSVGERDGVAYFTMPLIEGESLRERLDREGMVSPEEARRIVVEATRALAAAHAKGLVHRDVKPDNILLEGEESRVLLADFGIAKAMKSDGQTLTGSELFLGTPRYGSPEQMSGDPVDHRSDLYSLGVVAYRMLAGRPPFQAESTRKLVVKHLTEPPEPLRSLRPGCPEGLAAAVERCLAKDPEQRWPSAKALGEALTTRSDDEIRPRESRGRPGASDDHTEEHRRFRRLALSLSGGSAALLVGELLLGGSGVLGAMALVASVAVLAARAGRLWTGGTGWRALLGLGKPTRVATGGTLEEDPLLRRGYGDILDDGRRERASIVRLFEAMPRSRREAHSGLVGTVDQLLARLRQRARQLAALEDRLEEELAAADPTTGRPPLGAAALDDADTRARLGELESAREAARRDLGSLLAGLRGIRDGLDRVDPVAEELDERLATVRGLLRGVAHPGPPDGSIHRATLGQIGRHQEGGTHRQE